MLHSSKAVPSVNKSHIPSLPENNPYKSLILGHEFLKLSQKHSTSTYTVFQGTLDKNNLYTIFFKVSLSSFHLIMF